MSENTWMVVLALWALASPFFGLLAGWCLARYGHGRREVHTEQERRRIAAGLAATNRMNVK